MDLGTGATSGACKGEDDGVGGERPLGGGPWWCWKAAK